MEGVREDGFRIKSEAFGIGAEFTSELSKQGCLAWPF